jgi:hypothetical protein
VEALRVDHANHFLGLRLNDWTSLVVFLGAMAFLLVRRSGDGRAAGDDGAGRVEAEDAPSDEVPSGKAPSGELPSGGVPPAGA